MLIEGVVSGWEMVRSGVPQGSVLGPVLFVVFIDDIDENIRSTVLKFTDDTKVVARVGTEEDRETLRRDLVSLFGWSQDWQMLFNLDTCAVMHFGFNNIGESMDIYVCIFLYLLCQYPTELNKFFDMLAAILDFGCHIEIL